VNPLWLDPQPTSCRLSSAIAGGGSHIIVTNGYRYMEADEINDLFEIVSLSNVHSQQPPPESYRQIVLRLRLLWGLQRFQSV
jgi:hypothetical protein